MGNEDRLVGRAVTCTCMPLRPDLHYIASQQAKAAGFKGGYNKLAVDRLKEDDVIPDEFLFRPDQLGKPVIFLVHCDDDADFHTQIDLRFLQRYRF